MSSTQILILSLACIAGGIVLALFQEDKTLPLMLIGAGTATLTSAIVQGQKAAAHAAAQAEQSAQAAQKRADEAMERTGTITRDMLAQARREGETKKPTE